LTSYRSRGLLVAFTGLLVASLAACQPAAPAAKPSATREISVNTATADRTDIVSTLSFTGDVRARSLISIVPKVSGRIEKLAVDVGTPVKAGDIIAELDRVTAQLQLAQAEAGMAAARARLASRGRGRAPRSRSAANG